MTVHQLKIGAIDCAVLQEGAAFMDRESVIARYPNADPVDVAAALGEDEPSGSLNLLTLSSGGQRILVDVGFGESVPGMGGVLRGLAQLGISSADIDIIFLTHFHGDHIAGLCDDAGNPVYANARYIAMRAEWDEWMARWAEAGDEWNLKRFKSLRERFSFVDDGDEIAPGVQVVALPGHTNGHAGLLLESNGERLLHVVDLLHQAFQLEHIDWHFGFDTDGAAAVETRRQTLNRCVDEVLLTLFYHLEFPGLGHLARTGETFAFQPID